MLADIYAKNNNDHFFVSICVKTKRGKGQAGAMNYACNLAQTHEIFFSQREHIVN